MNGDGDLVLKAAHGAHFSPIVKWMKIKNPLRGTLKTSVGD